MKIMKVALLSLLLTGSVSGFASSQVHATPIKEATDTVKSVGQEKFRVIKVQSFQS